MSDTKEALFQLMRYNVMSSFTDSAERQKFTPAYVFAWECGVYPICESSADWHKPFPDQFTIKENQVEAILKFLDDRWLAKQPISFYELEDVYEVRKGGPWDRSILLLCCRYAWLSDSFDEQFWKALVKNEECPSEALSLCRPFKANEVFFL